MGDYQARSPPRRDKGCPPTPLKIKFECLCCTHRFYTVVEEGCKDFDAYLILKEKQEAQ